MEILEQYVKSVQFVDVVLVSLLLILSKFTHSSDVSIVDFEQVNTGWDIFWWDPWISDIQQTEKRRQTEKQNETEICQRLTH